jgi:hypothetical protein
MGPEMVTSLDVAVGYLNEHTDAKETQRLAENVGRKCLLIAGDIGGEKFWRVPVKHAAQTLGKIDNLSQKTSLCRALRSKCVRRTRLFYHSVRVATMALEKKLSRDTVERYGFAGEKFWCRR